MPLIVTAVTPAGYVTTDPHGPTLDGLLAAAFMRERLGDYYAVRSAQPSTMRPVEGLPLERVAHDDLWWYSCSTPLGPPTPRERHHFHRRFDDTEAAARVPAVRRVQDRAGPYKAARLPVVRTIAAGVTWHAIGDPKTIRSMLGTIDAIGGRRAAGFGAVAEWRIKEGGDADLARHHRPLPVAYARSVGRDGPVMLAGIRPPARLACNVVDCVVPA